jgi:hypothetical protein
MEKIMSKTTHNREVRDELTVNELDLVVGGAIPALALPARVIINHWAIITGRDLKSSR